MKVQISKFLHAIILFSKEETCIFCHIYRGNQLTGEYSCTINEVQVNGWFEFVQSYQ